MEPKNGTGLDEEDLDAVESRLRVKLPHDLRSLYKERNGGRLNLNCFPLGDELYEIWNVIPMGTREALGDLERSYKTLVESTEAFPKHVIPFAVDPGGDYYVYSLREDTFGSIYSVQSDYWDDPQRYMVLLAPTLAAFFAALIEAS